MNFQGRLRLVFLTVFSNGPKFGLSRRERFGLIYEQRGLSLWTLWNIAAGEIVVNQIQISWAGSHS